ncbi:uncharacterized protein NECHADRAFT_89209 [Fusarium vanettenii 77-13-4]|uniref:Zn(2)-C6 fungal-type domain-containing protein n=1 Tax=Fusarium vanettenii (strain ATCC MYA-4622 / CBS 123669 / FGSC 9596 / NRRL 45880 / 77-13-4) TaxID=660122 RepID=C7ZQI3_FUSV7|nr:uncharacterized protein NECHADRAFT_89209 [Fusarium vanettenii 77-13-4]EEU33724.1 hypothetical protein NECHADRAFT_89209 [Fusarium vanettenii 77-13-4]
MTDQLSTDDRRRVKSCKRCHGRKQRCHGFPICTNCARVKALCERTNEILNRTPSSQSPTCKAHTSSGVTTCRCFSRIVQGARGAKDLGGAIRARAIGSRAVGAGPDQGNGALGGTEHSRVASWVDLAGGASDAHRSMRASAQDSPGPRSNPDPSRYATDESFAATPGLLNTPVNSLPVLVGIDFAAHTSALRRALSSVGDDDQMLSSMDEFHEHPKQRGRAPPTDETGLRVLRAFFDRFHPRPSTWDLIRLAMRKCIDLRLHRKSHYHGLAADDAERQCILFWSVYSLERGVSIALSRPFSVADRDIDPTPPSETGGLAYDIGFTAQPSSDDTGSDRNVLRKSSSKLGIKVMQMVRLHSRIKTEVYSLDEPQETLFLQVEPLFASLEHCKFSLPYFPEAEADFLNLQYFTAISLLPRPFLGTFRPGEPLIKRCLEACGQTFHLLKRPHHHSSYAHSFVSSQDVLEALINRTMEFAGTAHLEPENGSPTMRPSIRHDFLSAGVTFPMANRYDTWNWAGDPEALWVKDPKEGQIRVSTSPAC